MKLSFIFELLLVFVLIAFAASAVIDKKQLRKTDHKQAIIRQNQRGKVAIKRQQTTDTNRYCSCSSKLCNCCRDFNLPVLQLKGPGCATLQYLTGDRLAISMSFGERVLTNTTINSKRPEPICMPLPGGVSKFCGRVYNIGRKGENFNACLGLELRALSDIEASVRVSCFKFGPQGLKLEPAQPLPVVEDDENDDDDDEDDDDDDDDDDEDDDDEDDSENDVDSGDYGTFSVLDDDFVGGYFGDEDDTADTTPTKKRKVTTTTTQKAPVRKLTKRPQATLAVLRRKVMSTAKPKSTTTLRPATTTLLAQSKVPLILPTSTEFSISTQVDNFQLSKGESMNNSQSVATVTPQNDSLNLIEGSAVNTAETILTDGKTEQSTESDDPLVEAVEDALNDDESEESTETFDTTTLINETTTFEHSDNDKKQGKDIFDDIADGVAESFDDGDDEEDDDDEEVEGVVKQNENDDEDDENEDDDDEDDDDESDLAEEFDFRRNFKDHPIKNSYNKIESRTGKFS